MFSWTFNKQLINEGTFSLVENNEHEIMKVKIKVLIFTFLNFWAEFNLSFCVCFLATGSVFYITGSFSYDQAVYACKRQGSELALVGQLYAAWRFQKYDQCNGGWLKDGSVRFPIVSPRKRCGGVPEAGVRTFGFPSKTSHLYGAYCYR